MIAIMPMMAMMMADPFSQLCSEVPHVSLYPG